LAITLRELGWIERTLFITAVLNSGVTPCQWVEPGDGSHRVMEHNVRAIKV